MILLIHIQIIFIYSIFLKIDNSYFTRLNIHIYDSILMFETHKDSLEMIN